MVESNYLHHIDRIKPAEAPIINFLAQLSYNHLCYSGSKELFITRDLLETFIFPDKDTISDDDLDIVKSSLEHFIYITYNPYGMNYYAIVSFYEITKEGLTLYLYNKTGLYYLCQYMLNYLKEHSND